MVNHGAQTAVDLASAIAQAISEQAQNGNTYGANGSAGGLKIELYVDGKQIIGAARIAERTMGKQMVSNGIILE